MAQPASPTSAAAAPAAAPSSNAEWEDNAAAIRTQIKDKTATLVKGPESERLSALCQKQATAKSDGYTMILNIGNFVPEPGFVGTASNDTARRDYQVTGYVMKDKKGVESLYAFVTDNTNPDAAGQWYKFQMPRHARQS